MARQQTLSGSKRARRASQDPNLFEDLPLDILEHVLSFLPIKEATQKCTIASRFRKSWHFNRKFMFGSEFAMRHDREYITQLVDRVFETHKGDRINSFQLHLDPVGVEELINKWLKICVEKGIEDLEFYFLQPGYTLTADSVSKLKQLNSLKLVHCELELPPVPRSMAGLGNLVLWHVPLTEHKLETLMCHCTMLQTVDLLHCTGICRAEIYAREHRFFKALRIAGCKDLEEVVVDSPTLRCVHYCGRIPRIRFIRATQLTEAFFNFEPAGNRRYLQASEMEKLVADVPNLTVLTASALVLEALTARFRRGVFGEACYGFSNLKELQLIMDGGLFCNPYDIVMFMKHCPLLDRLFIDMNDYTFECGPYWELHQKPKLDKFDHFFDRLKFIKLKGFKFLQSELQLAKILLKKATHLEALVLVTPKNGRTKLYKVDAPNYDPLFGSWKASPEAKIILFEHMSDKSRNNNISLQSYSTSRLNLIVNSV
ncbi:putative FBD-associated F-box protein [Spatholobus suberectus]|nr:putative FBD-associated F-box protein [Spatholobus suberectus]